MLYLDEEDIGKIGVDYRQVIDVIEKTVRCIDKKDFSQPIKPYLRYRDPKNRIIAMPAFVGGDFNSAGIKWIASFPGNIMKNIPRASSVVILNDADTGQLTTIINGSLLSYIRTAAVSGLMLEYFVRTAAPQSIKLGIIGWGPIGQQHYRALNQLYGDRIEKVLVYDLLPVDIERFQCEAKSKLVVARSWEEVYTKSNVFITCTVARERYIDRKPAEGSLLLNVSLRDYCTSIYDSVKNSIVVDDWDEVCREDTDIEVMHREKGLEEKDTCSLADVVVRNSLKNLDGNGPVMFNPMGMAVFDIAVAAYFAGKALEMGVGRQL